MGCSKRPSSKAAANEGPEAYPLGYVEDLNDARTLLADFFSIPLDYLFEYAVSGEWVVVEWTGERFPCRRPRLRGDTRWGKAPPLPSSIWVTISLTASATRTARGRSSVQ